MDLNEFLMLCRAKGYYNLNELQTVIIEPNGQLSILPKSDKRPVEPYDLGISPPTEKPHINVIVDSNNKLSAFLALKEEPKNDPFL